MSTYVVLKSTDGNATWSVAGIGLPDAASAKALADQILQSDSNAILRWGNLDKEMVMTKVQGTVTNLP
jgi:hypothetical protein